MGKDGKPYRPKMKLRIGGGFNLYGSEGPITLKEPNALTQAQKTLVEECLEKVAAIRDGVFSEDWKTFEYKIGNQTVKEEKNPEFKTDWAEKWFPSLTLGSKAFTPRTLYQLYEKIVQDHAKDTMNATYHWRLLECCRGGKKLDSIISQVWSGDGVGKKRVNMPTEEKEKDDWEKYLEKKDKKTAGDVRFANSDRNHGKAHGNEWGSWNRQKQENEGQDEEWKNRQWENDAWTWPGAGGEDKEKEEEKSTQLRSHDTDWGSWSGQERGDKLEKEEWQDRQWKNHDEPKEAWTWTGEGNLPLGLDLDYLWERVTYLEDKVLKLETQLQEERDEKKDLVNENEKQVMEKQRYKEDMENKVREMRREILTEAIENAERNGQHMKEDYEKNKIAQEAELMAEIAALQVVVVGMAAKDDEVMAMQEEARLKNDEAELKLRKCDALITGLKKRAAEQDLEVKKLQDKLFRYEAQEGGNN